MDNQLEKVDGLNLYYYYLTERLGNKGGTMRGKTILIIFLILLILIVLAWYKLCRGKVEPEKVIPLVAIYDSSGAKIEKLHAMDTMYVGIRDLEPDTRYDIRVLRSDDYEVSFAQLQTNMEGIIAPTPVWYDIGVEYDDGSRTGRFYISDLLKYKYELNVKGPELDIDIPIEILADLRKPIIFSADQEGHPLNSFLKGNQDVYAVGKNFPAGSTIRVYVVDDQYTWEDGDPLVDVSGGFQAVELEPNQTEFKVKVWDGEATNVGSNDIVADSMPFDGEYSGGNPEPKDGGSDVGFCVQLLSGSSHVEQQMTCKAPSPPPPAMPNPKYKDHFAASEPVWVAINPTVQGQSYGGKSARIYVIKHLPKSSYTHGMKLTDVSGGYNTAVIQPGCANVNYHLVWNNPTAGNYDVVVDFTPFGVYDKGTDIVDMLEPIGLLVGAPDIEARRIQFNWGAGSKAVNLKDHTTNVAVPVPEWDKTLNRKEPAAYIRGIPITVKVQFYKASSSIPNTVVVWADLGSGIALAPQTVTFSGAQSAYVSFTTSTSLSNWVGKHDMIWQWYYAVPPSPPSVQTPMNATDHTVCTTYKNALVNPAYKKPMLWTSQWARYLSDEKAICDAVIKKLPQSGLKYGEKAWNVDSMLDIGGGMCGGWYKMFAHMAGCQGVFVYEKYYRLQNNAAPSPEVKWQAIVIKDPGLNRTIPGYGSMVGFYDADSVYPYPASSDIAHRPTERRYNFWAGDGHCINFLEYKGSIYLYDPSFGTGPFNNTFTTIPSGSLKGTALTNFRKNYHDMAIDYMKGNIEYNDGISGNPKTYWNQLCIKTTLIPDLRIAGDPTSFEIHYSWL
jgi:hypothetical protein